MLPSRITIARAVAGIAVLVLSTSVQAHERVFRVIDSITMTRFTDSTMLYSPDGKYCAFVTSRGIIPSNALESTIWMLKTDEIQKYEEGADGGKTPVPRAVARWAAVSHQQDSADKESVITNMRWLPDSRTLLFLAENSKGNHQLMRAQISGAAPHALTPPQYDVSQFAWVDGTVIYETIRFNVLYPPEKGVRINPVAFDATGLDWWDLLIPHPIQGNWFSTLWIVRNGKSVAVIDPIDRKPLRFFAPGMFDLASAISPTANAAVLLLPVTNVPSSWSEYQPMTGHPIIQPPSSRYNGHWLVEYSLVNLTTGRAIPVVNAPESNALTSLGYTSLSGLGGSNAVIWSSSGARALLQNTFMPLEGVDAAERAKRRYPCMEAVFDLLSRDVRCLAFVTAADYAAVDSGAHDFPFRKAFFVNDNTVILTMKRWPDGALTDNHYEYKNGNWILTASTGHIPPPISSTRTFDLAVREDLNTPPALWAADARRHLWKKVWEPNPQLLAMNLGEVSVLRWKDASGYQWVAGLVKPPDYVPGKRYPLVIQTHGFDQNRFMDYGLYTSGAARPLASAGIIVLQMPVDERHELSTQEIPDQVRGFASAITLLNGMGLIDPHHVGLIGFSRTCYHVEGAIVQEPNLFAAASIADGVDEGYMQTMLAGNLALGEPLQIYGSHPWGEGLGAWIKDAPSFNLDRVKTPLLITALTNVGIMSEWEIYASLRMQKKPVDLLYLPQLAGYNHRLQRPLERLASEQTNVDWFRFWLQGYEDPNPAKAVQYRRWEALRKLQLN